MSKKITVLIPCHNEEKGIGEVIRKFPRKRLEKMDFVLDVLVIDNCSTDKTAEVARAAGARVITENAKGKGNAMRRGFRELPEDADYVVMIDGDDTYSPHEIMRMVEPLHNGFCNVVIGSRLGGKMTDNAMETLNRAGNWIYTHLVRVSYRVNVTDVLTGYFAWTREAIQKLEPHLKSDGFAIEMEMITKMARLGHEIYSVPISYHPRAGESNLRPFYDGWRILKMYARNLRWRPEHTQLLEDEVA
jgi:dolichol-phosphate hexosyltransferase